MYNNTYQVYAVVAQLVRASACHAEGRGFKSLSLRHKSTSILINQNKSRKKNPRKGIFACAVKEAKVCLRGGGA